MKLTRPLLSVFSTQKMIDCVHLQVLFAIIVTLLHVKKFLKTFTYLRKKTGVVYSFNNQHLTTFKDNFKLMGDQPFNVYFDLETTCSKHKCVFDLDEDHLTDMYVVSYCFIVTSHKSYSLNKITVMRSFNDSFVDLEDLS